MENPEEILHSLEEFSKMRPKDIPRELEDYLCFVAKTGDPVYQWAAIKNLFREKLLSVITEFYESCPSIDIPPCPNVDMFNYESMKNFILEKLDTFSAAPFTVQRICELLTTPRKEYNRIDKYMRALEKNILVVSTTEPGNRRGAENGDGIVNGLENEHLPETSSSNSSSGGDINVEEMDDSPAWPEAAVAESPAEINLNQQLNQTVVQETLISESRVSDAACSSSADTVITCRNNEEPYVSIEPVPSNTCHQEQAESDVSVTITAIPAMVQQQRRDSQEQPENEPVVSSENGEPIVDSEKEAADVDDNTVPESSSNEAKQVFEASEPPEIEANEPSEASEAEKSIDSTSQPKCNVEPAKQDSPTPSPETVETQDNVESTSTEDTAFPSAAAEAKPIVEDEPTEVTSPAEVAAATTTAEATAVPTVDPETSPEEPTESNESVASSPTSEEAPSEIPKHESESEENSKDSEVSSSSSSVASNEETNANEESLQKQADDTENTVSVDEVPVESAVEEPKQEVLEDKSSDAMQVDETGDTTDEQPDDESTNEAKTAVTEVPMEVEVSESPKTEDTVESDTTAV